MRTDMRQLLTPRMIQSMEILQMPQAELDERIELELSSNPTLELTEPDPDNLPTPLSPDSEDFSDSPRERIESLSQDPDNASSAEFDRLARIGEYLENEEWSPSYNNSQPSTGGASGERDQKLDALANTASRSGNLPDHLLSQWTFIDPPTSLPPSVSPHDFLRAGETIIANLQPDGYLRTDFQSLRDASPTPPSLEALALALPHVQKLDPAGIAARDLIECFLLQLSALELDEELAEGHDFPLERTLLQHHLPDLKLNRYPQLAKKLNRSIEDLQAAVKRLSHLRPYPGHDIGHHDAPPVTPDAVITRNQDTGLYEIQMTHDPVSNLTISQLYRKMVKDKSADRKTREFLANNVRNAKWLLDAIEQRKSTILRVIRQVVDAQHDFLENGPEFLRPLPMIDVAGRLGIHVATVSRAVSEKYIQTPQGIFPLRRFFSGGTTSSDGEDMAWDAVKEKLKILIAEEDKSDPLGDEQIVEKLALQGITLARRTVAKYRGLLNIPTARQRKQF